ncbi:MAG: beta-ketoacyl-[acyl-carrier-protein] synthase family protein [Jatrophihabitans sp.]
MVRVAVTGLGPVSSIGIGRAEFAAALRAGRSGISPISSFATTGFVQRLAGEVVGFEPAALLRRLDPTRWGRSSLLAAAAARLAIQDARLVPEQVPAGRAHAVIGTTSGESQVLEALTGQIVEAGFAAQDPDLLEQLPANRLANAVSTELGLHGESLTIATACSAGNYAIGYGYDLLVSGEADVVVVGGADSVCRWAHAGFARLGALTAGDCAPFDRDRSGILTGEGGAALILETFEHAKARGARSYAEVLGYGMNCDAHHPVAPQLAGIVECMRLAHRNAGVKADEVDYICAHGTGTVANDLIEGTAVLEVFGTIPPPISSIKSMLGHTMGAACAFGAIAATLAIDRGFLPPTINWQRADPALPGIDPVPGSARPARVRVAQNDGFAFGGNNAIVLLGALS